MTRYWVEYSFDSYYYMRLNRSSFTCDSSYITEEVKNKLRKSICCSLVNEHIKYFRIVGAGNSLFTKQFSFTREDVWLITLLDADWFTP